MCTVESQITRQNSRPSEWKKALLEEWPLNGTAEKFLLSGRPYKRFTSALLPNVLNEDKCDKKLDHIAYVEVSQDILDQLYMYFTFKIYLSLMKIPKSEIYTSFFPDAMPRIFSFFFLELFDRHSSGHTNIKLVGRFFLQSILYHAFCTYIHVQCVMYL